MEEAISPRTVIGYKNSLKEGVKNEATSLDQHYKATSIFSPWTDKF